MRRSFHRTIPVLLAAAWLSGCANEPSPEEQAAEAAREMALVEKGNSTLPPLQEVLLEPIAYQDIERHGLSGAGCNFAPGTSFATRVIARLVDAHFKIDGEIVRLAADSGSIQLPAGAHARYLGRTHEMRLQLSAEGEGESRGDGERADYQGTVTLLDQHGRLVYQGTGLAQCGA